MDNKQTFFGGIGFAVLLAIAFIVLKLCKVINWHWAWVLSPLWISFGIVAVIFIVALIVAAISN